MHVENIVRADRVAVGEPVRLRTNGLVGDEAEGGGTARSAIELEKDEIVPTGKEPDPVGGDALLADGAPDTVEERAKVILRTHPPGV